MSSVFFRRLLALALCAVLWACSEPPPPPVEIPNPDTRGMESAVRRALADARREVEAEPESGRAWGRYGMVADVHELDALALEAYARAAEHNPGEAKWLYLRGRLLSLAGVELEEAVELFENVRILDPEVPVVPYRLGETQAKLGDPRAAADAYRDAVVLDPEFARAHLGLGQSLLRLGELEEAVKVLEEAFRLEPRDAATVTALAQALRRAGRLEEAASRAELAAGLEPVETVVDPYLIEVSAEGKSSTLLVERALGYLEEGRFREALADLLAAEAERPEDPYVQRDLGKAYQGLEDPPAAIGHYEKALTLKDDLNEVRVQLGLLLVDVGRISDARRYLERARREAPEDAQVAAAVAIALLRAGQVDAGLKEMERAAALGPLSAPALDTWGTALAQQGRTEEARVRFRAAHSLMPEEPLILFHLGLLSEAEGQREQALVWYRRALDIGPNPMIEERLRSLGS